MHTKLDVHAARRHGRKPALLEVHCDDGDDAGETVVLELKETLNPGSILDGEVSIKLWMTPVEFSRLRLDLAAFARVMDLDEREQWSNQGEDLGEEVGNTSSD